MAPDANRTPELTAELIPLSTPIWVNVNPIASPYSGKKVERTPLSRFTWSPQKNASHTSGPTRNIAGSKTRRRSPTGPVFTRRSSGIVLSAESAGNRRTHATVGRMAVNRIVPAVPYASARTPPRKFAIAYPAPMTPV